MDPEERGREERGREERGRSLKLAVLLLLGLLALLGGALANRHRDESPEAGGTGSYGEIGRERDGGKGSYGERGRDRDGDTDGGPDGTDSGTARGEQPIPDIWGKPLSVAIEGEPVIVIDPGHGGFDPGKVGAGILEKDVNLAVAIGLRDYLTQAGAKVIMTRDSDCAVAPEGENRKVRDLMKRAELIRETAPALTVSIHQNSYPEEYVHGAQVFYYKDSTQGRRLAQCISDRLPLEEGGKRREIKGNNTYYLLKRSQGPMVIVECGFLSNTREAVQLSTPQYQEELSYAIAEGVAAYLKEQGETLP